MKGGIVGPVDFLGAVDSGKLAPCLLLITQNRSGITTFGYLNDEGSCGHVIVPVCLPLNVFERVIET